MSLFGDTTSNRCSVYEFSAPFLDYVIPTLTVVEYGWLRRLFSGASGKLVVDRSGIVFVVRIGLN
jgi:hypothetical protein